MLEYEIDTNTPTKPIDVHPEAAGAVADESLETMLDRYDDLSEEYAKVQKDWARGVSRFTKFVLIGQHDRADTIRLLNLKLSDNMNGMIAELLVLKEAILKKMI